MQTVTDIYTLTQSFPQEEMYGLTSQIRRSAVSIPTNIAEGYGRYYTQDYIRFLRIATGSLFELQTLLQISHSLDFISKENFSSLSESSKEIERMLSSLIRKLQNK